MCACVLCSAHGLEKMVPDSLKLDLESCEPVNGSREGNLDPLLRAASDLNY